MKRPGPTPTPTQVLIDRGSRRGRDRPSEVGYPKGAPPCPKFLSAPAKAEWRRVVKMLVEADVLQKTDLAALATYCRTWGEWCQLTEASLKWDYTDEGDRKQARMLADAEKRLQTFAAAFGFSAVAPAWANAGEASSMVSAPDSAK